MILSPAITTYPAAPPDKYCPITLTHVAYFQQVTPQGDRQGPDTPAYAATSVNSENAIYIAESIAHSSQAYAEPTGNLLIGITDHTQDLQLSDG